MSGRPWYRRYPGDYLADTRHLSLREHGAYVLLLDCFYASGRPLDPNRVHRICGAEDDEDRKAVDRIVVEFWTSTESGLRNPRADRELAISEARAKAGSIGGKRSKPPSKTPSKPKAKPKPLTRARGSDPDPVPEEDQEREFTAFWTAYPRKDSKLDARKAWGQTEAHRPELEELLRVLGTHAGTQQWRESRRFIPLPATWLRKRRWLDEVETGPEDPGGWEQTLDALKEP